MSAAVVGWGRVRGVVGGGGVGEDAGGRRRRPVERGRVRWVVGGGGEGEGAGGARRRGEIAIEMEGDRDRVSS